MNDMEYFDAEELSEVISDIIFNKNRECRLSKEHPEMTNDYLMTFGRYVKQEARFYNEGKDKKIKFSGLLGRCMREIKNSSMGATQ